MNTSMLSITLNGEPRTIRGGATLADLATEIGLDPAKVAVERNLEIVPRSTLAGALIAQDDAIEIVHFVGGGQQDDTWSVAGRTFTSRLIVGTGKYKDYAQNAAAVAASGDVEPDRPEIRSRGSATIAAMLLFVAQP